MSYQVYRNTTLGTTLQDSLDELLQSHQITETIKNKVLEEVNRFSACAITNSNQVRPGNQQRPGDTRPQSHQFQG